MNGPEHYAEAARLINHAQNEGMEVVTAARGLAAQQAAVNMLQASVAIAQVHADLARTAAMLEQGAVSTAWARAIGRDQGPSWPERPSV